jgi:hypothetical protein
MVLVSGISDIIKVLNIRIIETLQTSTLLLLQW